MAGSNDNIEKAFGYSLGNNFEENSNFDSEIEREAMNEAEKLHTYISTKNLKRTGHRTLSVQGNHGNVFKFQATSVKFIMDNGEFCEAEFSVPIGFKGAIRLWAEDLRGKRVWSTMRKIEEYDCNPQMLFDFLGKYSHRFTAEEMDDSLPF
ncbi:hypothetical protein KIH41_16880 [Litoribacter ruber]|uniref:hypothetical protein n=1 Tax=Litoribacter ruber TaxID=702568 RepID=UPI001BD9BE65|nr:hypothetical protein [Litoribacter ruber]MBT0812964.1 hypothetical protein [Litoribacter ruber]